MKITLGRRTVCAEDIDEFFIIYYDNKYYYDLIHIDEFPDMRNKRSKILRIIDELNGIMLENQFEKIKSTYKLKQVRKKSIIDQYPEDAIVYKVYIKENK